MNFYLYTFYEISPVYHKCMECNWTEAEAVSQKQPLEVFYKKAVLKNFAIFTGKHLISEI